MSPLQTRLKDRMELRAREEWPEMDQFVQLRKRIQDPPSSWFHTPFTPGTRAASRVSQAFAERMKQTGRL